MEKKNYLNVEEAAKLFGIPLSSFRKKVSMRWKNIPCLKIGRRIFFQRELLDEWFKNLALKN